MYKRAGRFFNKWKGWAAGGFPSGDGGPGWNIEMPTREQIVLRTSRRTSDAGPGEKALWRVEVGNIRCHFPPQVSAKTQSEHIEISVSNGSGHTYEVKAQVSETCPPGLFTIDVEAKTQASRVQGTLYLVVVPGPPKYCWEPWRRQPRAKKPSLQKGHRGAG